MERKNLFKAKDCSKGFFPDIWILTGLDRFLAITKSAFTYNRDETHHVMKKFLFTHGFYPRMKLNLKENLPLSMKTYNKIYHLSCFKIYHLSYHRRFPVNFAKFLWTPFIQNASGRLLLKCLKQTNLQLY